MVLDPQGCVLLFQYRDDRGLWWSTPGGGLEGEETFEEAAVREAAEELYLENVDPVPLWERTVEFISWGKAIRQYERYFLLRKTRDEITVGERLSETHRREFIVAARWWNPEELKGTSELVFPEDLAARMEGLP